MIDPKDIELSHEAVTTAEDGSNPNAIEYERTSWGHRVEDMSHPCAPDVDSGQPMPFRRGMRNHNVLDCLSATTANVTIKLELYIMAIVHPPRWIHRVVADGLMELDAKVRASLKLMGS